MKPIYTPKGAAKEYGDFAINIYTGCPHRCYYCFAPSVLHKTREEFHSHVEPRLGIVEAVKEQLAREHITKKLIHLCFTCDPYPRGYDTTITREIIELLKDTGNHVQILTKNGGDARRDFYLLDENDWFGVTYAGYPHGTLFRSPEAEPNAGFQIDRLAALDAAHKLGIKTWVSMEPVLVEDDILEFLSLNVEYVNQYGIGKLNYHPSEIDWASFGRKAERICKARGLNYYIKDGLRREMELEEV
ncbi:hypothetical protein SDC9_67926 [bioreactor metagenome]|uniref:Radical SAM core domain-containing protein n=1 Tax=bioreactor metagenome TaxID=1076179 RepID=A0A644XYZ5_9ZZZZ